MPDFFSVRWVNKGGEQIYIRTYHGQKTKGHFGIDQQGVIVHILYLITLIRLNTDQYGLYKFCCDPTFMREVI